MKALRFFMALAVLAAFMTAPPVRAAEPLSFEYREASGVYPDEQHPAFTFFCRYPRLREGSMAAEEINVFFDGAVSEMTELVLPMFANDEDMAGEGKNTFLQEYLVTCNNGEFFSTRMVQTQRSPKEEHRAVFSQVFAVLGEYSGQTLTLRGLLHEMGDSSEQIAAKVFDDIWQKIEGEMRETGSPWLGDLTRETLALDFYPQEHFYAGENGEAVFYLQPGLFRTDTEIVTFSYTAEDIGRMLNE